MFADDRRKEIQLWHFSAVFSSWKLIIMAMALHVDEVSISLNLAFILFLIFYFLPLFLKFILFVAEKHCQKIITTPKLLC